MSTEQSVSDTLASFDLIFEEIVSSITQTTSALGTTTGYTKDMDNVVNSLMEVSNGYVNLSKALQVNTQVGSDQFNKVVSTVTDKEMAKCASQCTTDGPICYSCKKLIEQDVKHTLVPQMIESNKSLVMKTNALTNGLLAQVNNIKSLASNADKSSSNIATDNQNLQNSVTSFETQIKTATT